MDRKLKHLEFVQGTINRLSTNSFLLKGWSVVLVSALFALAANSSKIAFVMLSYVPVIVFWGLDGYFLGLERAYRKHYEHIRLKIPEEIDFSMDTSNVHEGFTEWASATASKTLIAFHGSLMGAIVIVMCLLP